MTSRAGLRRLRRAGVASVAAVALHAVPARADAIPGGTYEGHGTDGAAVTFTVSTDGTTVDSYRIDGARGSEPGGGTCDVVAQGPQGQWSGAAVVDGAFKYNLGQSIHFAGTFGIGDAASGTFRLFDAAQGPSPACDTGLIDWTATGAGAGGAGNPAGGSNRPGTRSYPTRATLKVLSATVLGGRITSTSRGCTIDRTVTLWRGHRRLGTVRSGAAGRYRLEHARPVSLAHLRVTITAKRSALGICAATAAGLATV